MATITSKVLNTVDGKITFSIKMGGDIEKGTYTILDGAPTFTADSNEWTVESQADTETESII